MRHHLQDRLAAFTRRGTRDRGFVLVSTIMLFVMVAGTVYWLISATDRTTKSAVMTTDFVQSGQLADLAIQDAMYQLNEVRPSALPSKTKPRTGVATNDGTWSWYADKITDGTGGKRTVLHATGNFRATERAVQATVQAPVVGGFSTGTDKAITYQASPATVFSHTVTGNSVTVRSGTGAGNPFITGSIGLLGSTLSVKPNSGTTPAVDVDYYLYGPAAASASQPVAVRAPANLSLDSGFITDRLSTCAADTPIKWKASLNGGVLTANGNVGCYASMDFDIPTVIQGDGAFHAYVSGGVSVRENITAASGTGLNIYTNSNVTFPTEEASGTSLTVRNVFIYAPKGTCETTTPASGVYRSTVKQLVYAGSLACKTVRVAGQFSHVSAIDPAGKDTFDTAVWYLADYRQPAGSRSR